MLAVLKLRKTKNRTSSATKISAHSVNKAIKVRQANASWKTIMFFVLVTTLLTSFALEVQGHLPGITNEDCTDTGTNTDSGEISALAQLRNANFACCSWIRHNTSAQYNYIDGALNFETSQFQRNKANKQKTAEHKVSAKLEETLGNLQQMLETTQKLQGAANQQRKNTTPRNKQSSRQRKKLRRQSYTTFKQRSTVFPIVSV